MRVDIDSHYEDRKRALVRDLELEHREALKEFERWVSGETTTAPSPQESKPTANGSSGSLTTRQMLLKVMPELQNGTFTSSDIRDKILERWPNLTNKQLPTYIAHLLKGMYEDGVLDRRKKGPRIQDPYIYEVREGQEGKLLMRP
jgi:hypothetical protein